MAVVEVGWTIRAGYIGDARCTRQSSSICFRDGPMETSFPSILMAAEATGVDIIQSVWTVCSLERGMNQNVEQLEYIMGNKLQCSKDDPLMLVLPEALHERTDLVRELFRVVLEAGFTSALYCFRPSVAWTLASGRTSAVVLDVGHNQATTTAVLDGYALRNTVASSSLAGRSVTGRLIEMLDREQLDSLESIKRYRVPSIRNWALDDMVNDIKRMACFVRVGHSNFSLKEEPLVLRAPDGNSVTVSASARTEPYEMLFSPPTGFGVSLAELVVSCKKRLDPEWLQQAVPHVFCGGTSQAPGFCDRIIKEAQKRDSCYFRYEKEGSFHVFGAVDGAWTGASLAAASSSFASLWVTRADLEEEGDSVLYRKLLY
ncbi:putative actin-like protein [Trypanosoma cruzi]|uniref:Actin-like protein 4 n=2 Tax=Trypanosoma cruzi TaxID=5693 RepID=Q4DX54_TRYCC|nr:actin-like protein, putative [Trypanosoma cruzi]ABF58719.1 actin-like protein 4 [Trypanosoma cruzi strain CL Brener]EAN97086.1 actin-like protein, putative [Trypanosoma cruzi]PWV11096.1 putative actin-like protein [Trypanosoma cruzi]RNC46949.1 putative actin [Trypanosoma cruzi]|eukprot:XP_818937.1 actin-like protein [Trypanosoma cruzi strain CL Brener]